MANVFVTNNSSKLLKDGFAGVFYEFKPNETVEIPSEAAHHIFGYGEKDKAHYVTRLGWSVSQNDLEEAINRLNTEWVISVEPPKPNHVLSPVVDQVPSPRRVRGKVLSAVA